MATNESGVHRVRVGPGGSSRWSRRLANTRAGIADALRSGLDSAVRGTRVMVVVYGDPGHGKTTILDSAAEHAASLGATVVRLTGKAPDGEIPYAGIRTMLASHLPLVGAERSPTQRLLRALVTDFVPPSSALAVCGAVSAWIDCLAPGGSVALFVDDADYVDEDTLRVLAYVASREEAGRVAVVCAATANVDLLDRVSAVPFVLDDLEPSAAVALIRGQGVSSALSDHLLRRLGGNPLALTFAASSLATTDDELAPVHPRLTAHVEERLAPLPPEVGYLLEAAAVCHVDNLGALSAWSEQQGLGAAEHLVTPAEDVGLVTTEQTGLVWQRPWIAESVARMCPPGRRERLRSQLTTTDRPRPQSFGKTELGLQGDSPRRRPAAADLLTTAERRVARVIVGGATTRQAAERLGVSQKTIDAHLQHIYRKLDVRSRSQLVVNLLPSLEPSRGTD